MMLKRIHGAKILDVKYRFSIIPRYTRDSGLCFNFQELKLDIRGRKTTVRRGDFFRWYYRSWATPTSQRNDAKFILDRVV